MKAVMFPDEVVIVGQTTETWAEMQELGRNIDKMMYLHLRSTMIIFSNNDYFLNGIRQAVKAGKVKAAAISIFYVKQGSQSYNRTAIDDQGRISPWVPGIFDGINTLCEQLQSVPEKVREDLDFILK